MDLPAPPRGRTGGAGRAIIEVVRALVIAAAVLLVLLLSAAAVWVLWQRRRRRRTSAPPAAAGLKHPVVLVHGIVGFDEIRLFGWKRGYFAGIGQHLRELGVTVHQARLPPLASVPERAARLAEFIRGLGAERVNIIAHSMGGIDARYAITKLGLADKIASLVTIGTPHHGTPLAELGQIGPALTARALVKRLGISSDSLDWLTPSHMAAFNVEISDDPRVVYASVVCRAGGGLLGRNPLLVASHAYVKQRAGTNDGLVPAWSQRWGRMLCEIQADHWAQIGWFSTYDARPVYALIVQQLARDGF
jgi:triacylglycerol lipase